MKNYFEYFPCGPSELAWGFHVSACGHTRIGKGQPYPPQHHPADHHFTWERGRVLPALQVVFISSGAGCYEWREGRTRLRAGQCFLVLPGRWHRYRPDRLKGWIEHWFELRGAQVDRWLGEGIFTSVSPTVRLRKVRWIRTVFRRLHECCLGKPFGYRPVIAGLAMSLLAEILGAGENFRFTESKSRGSRVVREAREIFAQSPSGEEKIASVAARLHVSYPTLHRHFVRETGLTPKQYADQIRLAHAEELLCASDLSVKEISARLKFHSAFHFSVQFKKWKGMAPSTWRQRIG